MDKTNEIELSSIEATAYWWVNIIKNKVRELVIKGTNDKNELKFVKLFYSYTQIDWRNLYLELISYITEDVNNYIPDEDIMGIDGFNQSTAKKEHPRLNSELSKILNMKIPDIRLANSNLKDSVIYTNIFGACVWYKSCGTTNLPTKYDPCYILTGNLEEFDFYNLLLATLITLKELDKDFNLIQELKEVFLKEYQKINNKFEDIEEKFDYYFSMLNDLGLIYGRYWGMTYSTYFREIDYVGLEKYMYTAREIANLILKNNKEKTYVKK